jgi:catechol 2,3-dioxygenase-like lactoylglutathione lyase family enzyme
MTESSKPNANKRKSALQSYFLCYLLILVIGNNVGCSSLFIPAFIRSSSQYRLPARICVFATNEKETSSFMSQNQLMHIMLRVPNVNATVDFWTSKGANVHSYRKTSKAETAFVGFGKQQGGGYFSLEITALLPEETTLVLGNVIKYFGLSMLLGMDLQMAAAGEQLSTGVDQDPNGLEIRRVASAPGDSFSRLCLATDSQDDILSKTTDFYKALGMELVAGDDSLVCLRYTAKQDGRTGVATTLVFEKAQDSLDFGNCFDHLAISTVNVDAAATVLRATLDNPDNVIFMEPKPMFGTKIMGVYDPNGYKVYLVERASS